MEATLIERDRGADAGVSSPAPREAAAKETLEEPMKQYMYFAFRRSTRDAESYETAAALIPADERRAFLTEMALRKRQEAEKLYAYYQADAVRMLQNLKKRNAFALPHYQAPLDPAQIASIEDTYSFAFKREHSNLELYSKLSGLDSNPNTKLLFNYLCHLQMSHIAFVEKKLVEANGRFFADWNGSL